MSEKEKEQRSEKLSFCNRQWPHLEDVEQGRHVEPVEAERDTKYSWCQEEHQQKGQPHGDGDAEASAERVSSGKCEPSHAAEEAMSGGDCSGWDLLKNVFLPFFVFILQKCKL